MYNHGRMRSANATIKGQSSDFLNRHRALYSCLTILYQERSYFVKSSLKVRN